MRYITIPHGVQVVAEDGTEQLLTFAKFLETTVWCAAFWRQELDGDKYAKMFFEVKGKFDGALPGEIVELSNAEYEAFRPLATMRGEKVNPTLAGALMKLMMPVFQSPNERPSVVKVTPASQPTEEAAAPTEPAPSQIAT